MNLKSIISSKIALLLLISLALFLGNIKFTQWRNQQKIEKEKQGLTNQEDQLLKKNQELQDSLSYLTSSNFKERAFRQQLNMKKEGEIVYSFTQSPTSTSAQTSTDQGSKIGNPEKWWNYFFGN